MNRGGRNEKEQLYHRVRASERARARERSTQRQEPNPASNSKETEESENTYQIMTNRDTEEGGRRREERKVSGGRVER